MSSKGKCFLAKVHTGFGDLVVTYTHEYLLAIGFWDDNRGFVGYDCKHIPEFKDYQLEIVPNQHQDYLDTHPILKKVYAWLDAYQNQTFHPSNQVSSAKTTDKGLTQSILNLDLDSLVVIGQEGQAKNVASATSTEQDSEFNYDIFIRYLPDPETFKTCTGGKTFSKNKRAAILTVKDIPVYLYGTDFTVSVWEQLAQMTDGEVLFYRDILERTTGTVRKLQLRAAASSIGKNPLPILLPCHRVVATQVKDFDNYTGPEGMKTRLLELEGFNVAELKDIIRKRSDKNASLPQLRAQAKSMR